MAIKKHRKKTSAVVHFSEESTKKIFSRQDAYKKKNINVSVAFIANQIIEESKEVNPAR